MVAIASRSRGRIVPASDGDIVGGVLTIAPHQSTFRAMLASYGGWLWWELADAALSATITDSVPDAPPWSGDPKPPPHDIAKPVGCTLGIPGATSDGRTAALFTATLAAYGYEGLSDAPPLSTRPTMFICSFNLLGVHAPSTGQVICGLAAGDTVQTLGPAGVLLDVYDDGHGQQYVLVDCFPLFGAEVYLETKWTVDSDWHLACVLVSPGVDQHHMAVTSYIDGLAVPDLTGVLFSAAGDMPTALFSTGVVVGGSWDGSRKAPGWAMQDFNVIPTGGTIPTAGDIAALWASR